MNYKTIAKLSLVSVGIGIASFGVASSVNAAQMLVKVLQDSTTVTSNVIQQVPIKSCRMDQVPIYSTEIVEQRASFADKAVGAVIGGVVGSHIGDGSGREAATFLGAIVGAEMADDNGRRGVPRQVVSGYRQQEVCEMATKQQTVNEVIGYNTYIDFGGQIWQLDTPISYSKGDFIKVDVHITMAN